ncbi:formylglycine-generating enzyme family protein [Pendulispora brunnea]|uniref:Formylglycine-generating enzyme family protein n=1 Tax=Pendulispora brunnea TaxID=2905690 RepID=A0ABZ2JZE9_9BACT
MKQYLLAALLLASAIAVAHAQDEPEQQDAPAAAPPPPEDGETDEPAPAPPKPPPRASTPKYTVPFADGMLRLPGGRFTMGSGDPDAPPNERPPHKETVAAFWIDKTEVTVEAYRACVDRHMCARPVRKSADCTYDLDDPSLPISCVSWKDADTYCRAVGKRLPREAEWEFAARATFPVRYPWGGGWTYCTVAATLVRDSSSRTCTGKRPSKVGAHPSGSSPFGVLDLTGNVEEWTSDWYAEHVAEGAAPRAGASHVLRGGGWLSSPSASRTTSRNWGSSMEAGPNVGFRCAKD